MEGRCRSKKWTVNKVGALPQREPGSIRSEEHTSELQSHSELVCRLLLEKKKEEKEEKKKEKEKTWVPASGGV